MKNLYSNVFIHYVGGGEEWVTETLAISLVVVHFPAQPDVGDSVVACQYLMDFSAES